MRQTFTHDHFDFIMSEGSDDNFYETLVEEMPADIESMFENDLDITANSILPNVMFSPSYKTVSNILAYSRIQTV